MTAALQLVLTPYLTRADRLAHIARRAPLHNARIRARREEEAAERAEEVGDAVDDLEVRGLTLEDFEADPDPEDEEDDEHDDE